MALHFFVQCERNENVFNNAPTLDTTGATLVERIGLHNWSHPEAKVTCDFGQFDLLRSHVYAKNYLQKVIPVGSIEFTEAVVAQAFGVSNIHPQNIPEPLQDNVFSGRRLVPSTTISSVPQIMTDWNVGQVFLKSATRSKGNITGIYNLKSLPQTEDEVLVSEVLPLLSEWRVFVFKDMVQDIRHYTGSPYAVPHESVVKNMVRAMDGRLESYTLDVGVTAGNQRTVIIEVHNFISCGLYGASMPLGMYAGAYRQELVSQGISADTLYS